MPCGPSQRLHARSYMCWSLRDLGDMVIVNPSPVESSKYYNHTSSAPSTGFASQVGGNAATRRCSVAYLFAFLDDDGPAWHRVHPRLICQEAGSAASTTRERGVAGRFVQPSVRQ